MASSRDALRRGAKAMIWAASAACGASTASAAEFRWANTTNPLNSYFELAGNWALVSGSGSAPPGSGDDALFNAAATYEVRWDSVTLDRTNRHLNLIAGTVTFRSLGGLYI